MRSFFALILSWMKKIASFFTGKTVVDGPAGEPDIGHTEIGPGEVVCYYGCPNSKKAKKLQLNKKVYR